MKARSLLLALVACSKDTQIRIHDAAIDSTPDTPAPNVVIVDAFGTKPLLMMYRDGSGPWRPPFPGNALYVHDAFELVAVCGDAINGYQTAFVRSTYEEARGRIVSPCFQVASQPVPVNGTMTQPGAVAIGTSNAQSTTSNWWFELSVEPGVHDVVAYGVSRVQLQRGVQLAGATTLPNLDVMADGIPMPQVTVALNDVEPDDLVSADVYLITQTDFVRLPTQPSNVVRVVPLTLLTSLEHEFIWMHADRPPWSRGAFYSYSGGSLLTYRLMPRLDGVTFEGTSVTWSTLPPHDEIELYFASGSNVVHLVATPGWLAGATTAAIDTDIPGYQQEWMLGPIELSYFGAQRDAMQTGISQVSPFAPQARLPRDALISARLRRDIR